MNLGKARRAVGAFGLVLAGMLLFSGSARAAEDWSSEIWFDVLFDESGQVRQLTPVNEAEHPAGFWAQLTQRVQRAHIPPVQQDGQAATFRTGVVLSLLVTKGEGGGAVSIKGLNLHPIPLKRYAASYPQDVGRLSGWDGEVMANCTVDRNGACVDVTVEAPAGMPDSVRRWAKSSAEGWRFKPQEINGQAIETRLAIPFRLHTSDDMPVNFREPRKL